MELVGSCELAKEKANGRSNVSTVYTASKWLTPNSPEKKSFAQTLLRIRQLSPAGREKSFLSGKKVADSIGV